MICSATGTSKIDKHFIDVFLINGLFDIIKWIELLLLREKIICLRLAKTGIYFQHIVEKFIFVSQLQHFPTSQTHKQSGLFAD